MNTQEDFRIEFYNKYFSTFKIFINEDLKSEYAYFKRKYLPLIKIHDKNVAIIDIGCGSGRILKYLKLSGFQNLYGIDISEEQIRLTREKGFTADVFNVFDFLETSKKKFDIIFALDIIEHFHKYELIKLFSGFFNLLNKNGFLIIHTPNGEGVFSQHAIYGDLTHLTIFNPNSLNQILQITGFKKNKFFETGPVPKNIKGFFRFILWNMFKLIIKSIRIVETGGTEKILTQDFICLAQKEIL